MSVKEENELREAIVSATIFGNDGQVVSSDRTDVHVPKVEKQKVNDSAKETDNSLLSDVQFVEKNFSNYGSYGCKFESIDLFGQDNKLDEKIAGGVLPQSEIIEPPIKLHVWCKTMDISTRLNRCIRTYARNTRGLGWEVVPKKPINDDTPQEEIDEINFQLERVKALFENPNDEMPFTMIAYIEKIDEESMGTGYYEIVESNTGELEEGNWLFHVHGRSIKILRNDRGYVQELANNKKVFFKKFGITDEKVKKRFGATSAVMDSRTGRYVGEPLPNGDVQQPPEIENRASALLCFPLYNPSSSTYGLPRYMSCGLAIAGNRMAARRNVAFFDNDATPRFAVLVSGGQLTSRSLGDITKFMDVGKGVENAHRVLVLETDVNAETLVETPGGKRSSIQLIPLTVGLQDDASFESYRAGNDEEVRECFGLAKIYFTSEDTNKASANVGKKITDEQEFEPDRVAHEYIINHKILRHPSINATLVKFKFKRPQLSDPTERAALMKTLSDIAAVTPDEVREEFGLSSFPDSYNFARKPLTIGLEEFKLGLAFLTRVMDEEMRDLLVEPTQGSDSDASSSPSIEEDGNDDGDGQDSEEKSLESSLEKISESMEKAIQNDSKLVGKINLVRERLSEAFEKRDNEYVQKLFSHIALIGAQPNQVSNILDKLLQEDLENATSNPDK